MRGTWRVCIGAALAVVLAVAGLAVAGPVASAQSAADVEVRDRLITDQENLLNTYRCRFGVDVHAVLGQCPNPDVLSPAVAPQSPSQHDIDVRDGLIQSQEALLNAYRCRFGIDTEIVPGGCGETAGGQPAEPITGSGHQPPGAESCPSPIAQSWSLNNGIVYYCDVEPDYYDEDEDRAAGDAFDSVNRLWRLGVLDGTDCGPREFCPGVAVDGATFAVWLARILEGSSSAGSGALDRLAELGVAAPCSGGPDALCPSEKVNRAKAATFISRALALPEADPIGFWDVKEDSYYFDHINRLVAAGIDDGCSEVRFTPFNFCPNQIISRGELAELLSEVIDYIEAEKIIRITKDSKPDNSIGLSVSFEEAHGWSEEIKVAWTNPKNEWGGVSHYILQWRPSWDGFNYRRYQVVEYDEKGRYEVELPRTPSNKIYAFRVIVAYSNKNEDHLATDEVKMANQSHKLQDAIEEHIIDAYGEDQPWLVDAWRYSSGPALSLYPRDANRVTRSSVGDYNQLQQTVVGSLTLSHYIASDLVSGDFSRYTSTVIHELGHVYTLTNGIAKNEASIAVGHLYLGLLNDYATRRCASSELYADLAMAAFWGGFSPEEDRGPNDWGGYFSNCGFDLDQKTSNQILKDVRDLTQKVFLDQETPQWFYDEYQKRDGSINLDKLWADISTLSGREKGNIIYGLRNEFGGYCSTEDLYRLHIGEIEIDSLDTPWRDAGGC